MVRCFLVNKVLKEKRVETLGRMQHMVFNLGKRTGEGMLMLRKMKAIRDHLKALADEATKERIIQQTKVEGLKKLLEDTKGALESTEECVSRLRDEVLVDSVNYFEEARGQVTLLYPHLDLSLV